MLMLARHGPRNDPRGDPRRLRPRSRSRLLAAGLAALVAGLLAWQLWPSSGPAFARFAPTIPAKNGLVTNEVDYASPHAPGVHSSRYWWVTSGSLFARDGFGWTGKPDRKRPNLGSTTTTDSAVFRMISKRSDFGDVAVRLSLRNDGYVDSKREPTHPFDGIHVFLRYHSERELYVVSVDRRDDTAVIKKKVPGGPANGGDYVQIGHGAPRHAGPGHWHLIQTSVVTNGDGSVTIALSVDGKQILQGTDHGQGGPPITDPGRVGLRGDNTEFEFADFRAIPASDADLTAMEAKSG